MEVNTELNFYQKIVDFIVENYPEQRTSQFKIKVVGEEAPSTFIILVAIYDVKKATSNIVLILYECSFHGETPKSNSNLSFILRLENANSITKDGEEICYASLSFDRQFLALTLLNKINEEISYTCCILNLSLLTFSYELLRLHVIPSLKQFAKIQFIQNPIIARRTMNAITKNSSLFNLQSSHLIFSVTETVIKYQRVLMSPNSAMVENENILSSKLHYHNLKSELDRLYILERSSAGNFNLKAFQILWPQSEEEEMKSFDFQLIFSYQLQLPNQQVDVGLINTQILEHSSGAICLCYELQSNATVTSGSSYAYCVHLINSDKIIECRTPAYAIQPPGKILFTMYKSYITVITKYFIHLIDIYCHSKQICSYIWPTCFTEKQFLKLKCLNAIKLANMYFLYESSCIFSVKPNLYNIATMIKESSSVTQKVGAVNFLVYNHLWKSKENSTQVAMEFIIFTIKNSFTIARLMEEYITASVNRYLRIKVTQEKIMKLINNTTLSSQFSNKLSTISSPENLIIDNDLVIINLQSINEEALVIFAQDNLPNPQINRFLRLSSDSNAYKTNKNTYSNTGKIELVFENSVLPEEPDIPSYLAGMSLSDEQTEALDRVIQQKIGNSSKIDLVNSQGFVEKIRFCTIKAWKRLLFLIHKTVFDGNEHLWNDLRILNKSNDRKINCFHGAIGAFRYVLLKEQLSVPAAIEEIYLLTSYYVLSDERFLIYLKYSDFLCVSNISLDFFKEFYKKLSSTFHNTVLMQIKEIIISKMSIEDKMAILSLLNREDQDPIIKEYWDNVHRRTNVFSKYYSELILNGSRSCDSPQNALDQFYKLSSDKVEFNETLK